MFALLKVLLQPGWDALSCSGITLALRLRMLIFQPIHVLIFMISGLKWNLVKPTKFKQRVVLVPVEDTYIRAICFIPNHPPKHKFLHIAVHGGGFFGGFAEGSAEFASFVTEHLEIPSVSVSHRLAPRYGFPTAHDDVRTVVKWLLRQGGLFEHHEILASGYSAGGNLALSLATDVLPPVRAWIGFYSPVDLRLPQWQKPKSGNFPKFDPLGTLLLPLNDVYANSAERVDVDGVPTSDSSQSARKICSRLNPILRTATVQGISRLPGRMLVAVAGIDLLVKEQLNFYDDVKKHDPSRIDIDICNKAFHGWLEMPTSALPSELQQHKQKLFEKGLRLFADTID